MRIRSVKPEFWNDQKVGVMDAETRLAFIWTWGAADDWGCLKLSPGALRSGAFECHDMTLARGREIIDTLTAARRVIGYVVDGETYAFIPSWFKHQRPNNPAAPLHPIPPIDLCDEASVFLREYANVLRSECSGRERKNTAAMSRAYQSLPIECLDTKSRAARGSRETLNTLSGECQDTSAPGAGEQGSRGAGEQGSSDGATAHILLAGETPQPNAPPPPRPWSRGPMTRADAVAVFEYWKLRFGKDDRNIFEGKREESIRARANEGMKRVEAMLAVLGCFVMGKRDLFSDGKKRIEHESAIKFTLIFRSDEQARGFIDTARASLRKKGMDVSEDGSCITDRHGKVVERL